MPERAAFKDLDAARVAADGVLLDYQKAWVEDQSPVKVCEKSRRIGLSWTEAADAALTAASRSGLDHWYVGYNKDMAREFINDAAFWAGAYDLAASAMEEIVVDDPKNDITAYRIRFASGNRVTALSSRPTNLRGKSGVLTIDEAAFHDDLGELLKAGLAFLMWGGRVRVISTHNGEQSEFNRLCRDVRAGKKPYSPHKIDLDAALSAGLYRRICRILGKDWTPEAQDAWRADLIDFYGEDADEELFCVPGQGQGVFLTRAVIETCLDPAAPVLRYEQPADFAARPDHVRRRKTQAWLDAEVAPFLETIPAAGRSFFGEDFGRSGDLTVICPLVESGTRYAAPFVIELRNIPFREQEQILFFVVDRLPRFTFGALDARGNGQYLAEVAQQKYGAGRIEQVMISPGFYAEQMPRFKAAFEDDLIRLPADEQVIEDLRAFRTVGGVARLPEKSTAAAGRKKRHGDAAIAAVMAWYAAGLDRGQVPTVKTRGRRPTAGRLDAYRLGGRGFWRFFR
jgi:phage FluMu gp28-like protein